MIEEQVDIENVENSEKVSVGTSPDTVEVMDDNVKKIDELTQKLTEMQDKYLRTAAELENTRRRSILDSESKARNRAMGVAEKILPVMDAVMSAQKHNPDDEGIKSMVLALENSFAQIGITKIDSVGQVLNPMFHNVIQVVEGVLNDDGKSVVANTIIQEMQAGYMFGDTVLRTAMVVVAK